MTSLELIGLIYDAVPDGSRWQVFLDAFVSATTSKRGTLILIGSGLALWRAVCWHGWKADEIRLHTERYAAVDPWATNSVQVHEGEIRRSTELCPQEEMEQSTAYREFYGPLGIDYGFGGIILRTEAGMSAITVQRGKPSGPYSESEVAILRPLMPHLRRAAVMHGEFMSMRAQLATFTGHLDRQPHPFVLTDAECRILYANAAADEILASRDGLAAEDGHFTVMSAARHKFRQATGEVIAGRGLLVRHFEVARPSEKAPYRLLVAGVPNFGAVPLGTSLPAAAILVITSDVALELDQTVLRQLFSLTSAEVRITGRLVLGRSVEEISIESGVSIETVRSQVRSVLSKTGTSRQGELISLILRMVPFSPS